jgi:hypothetical protein
MKTQMTFAALALSTVFAAVGCATEAELTQDEDAVDETEELVGTATDEAAGDFEAAARALQHDCGIVTCTIRLNRAWTKKAQSTSSITEVAEAACELLPAEAARAICKQAVKLGGKVLSGKAKTYYGEGNCLGIRYSRTAHVPGAPAAAWPVRVKRNEHNCQ